MVWLRSAGTHWALLSICCWFSVLLNISSQQSRRRMLLVKNGVGVQASWSGVCLVLLASCAERHKLVYTSQVSPDGSPVAVINVEDEEEGW